MAEVTTRRKSASSRILILAVAVLAVVWQAVAGAEDATYTIHEVKALPPLEAGWEHPAWQEAETLTIQNWHPQSSDHRPKTQVRVLHDGQTLALMFRVEDQYVAARAEEYQGPVYKDSCVEFFVSPKDSKSYFNFEMNCGGTLLLYHHADPSGVWKGEHEKTPVAKSWAERIKVHTSLPKRVDPEITEPITWTVSYRIPIALFQAYVGALGEISGQAWRANFYKCADATSHPHWGYWTGIGEELNFHQPLRFGKVVLE